MRLADKIVESTLIAESAGFGASSDRRQARRHDEAVIQAEVRRLARTLGRAGGRGDHRERIDGRKSPAE